MCNEKIAECEGVREIYDPSRRTIFFEKIVIRTIILHSSGNATLIL
jgi:hypothetical protein